MEHQPYERRFQVVDAGERVDRYVVGLLPDLSRTAVQRLIREGTLRVNAQRVSASYRLRVGDEVVVCVPEPQPLALVPEAAPLDILYEDGDMLVINKDAGLVVHPGAGHKSGTLVNAVLAHCTDLAGVGGAIRPGIVHRLDKDTSGIIVIAKHDKALLGLQRQFKARTVEKHYLALVAGWVLQEDGIIEAPIGRDRQHRQRMAVRSDGKPAYTRWHVLQRYQDAGGAVYTLLDVLLLTGRTHQIRVHFAWLGFPLAGDAVYGAARSDRPVSRQFLHARELALLHPITGESLRFVAPLPKDLADALRLLTERD